MNNHDFDEVFEGDYQRRTRPPRPSTCVRQSHNEEIPASTFGDEGDAGVPHAASHACYNFLRVAGLLENFQTLVGNVGLTSYMMDGRPQYYWFTKTFSETFTFNTKSYGKAVSFKIYDMPCSLTLQEFCGIIDTANVETTVRIVANPPELAQTYQEVTDNDTRFAQRDKIMNIQFPAIKYFA